MERVKRIPYGKADFEAVNSQNDYYVDKTHYIPRLENTPYIFLIRPRRFGKSLFLSMLWSYYDLRKKDRFEAFYRDTWIYRNPTAERGSYMILYFNFSAVLKEKERVQEDFNKYCNIQIEGFLRRYGDYLPEELAGRVQQEPLAHNRMHLLAEGLAEHDKKIYLLIDEYDNFANSIIADYGTGEYQKLTREAGYFKQFFTNLKLIASGSGSGLARIFITGVSPVTMDDVTSGFNVGNHISKQPRFNEILGFTEEDVRGILSYYRDAGVFLLDPDETLKLMRKWYGNYRFAEDASMDLYNSDAILYFLNAAWGLQRMPVDLIDDNLRMDYGKLRNLITLDQRLNGNFRVLQKVLETGKISSAIHPSFPQDRLADRENFISLLFFFGLLTFTGKEYKGQPLLTIPNETIRTMMYSYIRESYYDSDSFAVDIYELRKRCQLLAYDGNWQPVFRFIAEEIEKQTRIRDYIQGEKVIQSFFLAYLNITDFYLSLSEEEMNKGYADIVLKPFSLKYPDIPFAYLLEFKYIPRTEKQSQLHKTLTEKLSQSRSQLARYRKDDFSAKMLHLPPYGKVVLKKGIIIFHGWEMVHVEEVE